MDFSYDYVGNAEIFLPIAPTTQTGTISSTGKIVSGTSTKFLSECQVNGYLYNGTDFEFIKIVRILSDVLLELEYAPATAFSGDTVEYIEPIRCANYVVSNTGSSTATLYFRDYDGSWTSSVYRNGLTRSFGVEASVKRRSDAVMPKPQVIDGSLTNISVTITY